MRRTTAATATGPGWSAWRDRGVLAIAVGRAASFLGDVAALTVLTLRVHDAGGGAVGVTALLVSGFLPFVLFLPLTGRLVDRFPRRRVVLLSSLLQAVVAGALAVGSPLAVTVGLAFVLGSGQAVAGAAWQTLLAEVVTREHLTPALGTVQSLRTAAGIAGPGLAGLLVGSLGYRTPMLAVAVVFAATAALVLRVRVPAGPAPDPGGAATTAGGGVWSLIRADPLLRSLLLLFGSLITISSMDSVVEVFFVRDTLGASSTWYGLAVTLWSVGMLVGALSGRWWNRPDDPQPTLVRTTLWSATVLVAVIGCYALVPSVGWLVPVSIAGGVANGVLNLSSSALVLHRAPVGAVGRVSALVSAVTSGAQVGSMVLGGVLLGLLTPREIYAVAGICGVVLSLAAGPALLRGVRLPSAGVVTASAGPPTSR